MGASGRMGSRKSTCLYLDQEVAETARQLGLNLSKVSENALAEAIGRLSSPKQEDGLRSQADVEGRGRGRDLNPGARLHRRGDVGKLLSSFFDFCRVDLGLSENTAKEYRRKMRGFFRAVRKPARDVTAEDVRDYLKPFCGGSPNSYGNALKPLKKFFRDFMRMDTVVESFKFRKITLRPVVVPTREVLRRFYRALRTERARALFLMYASSGLRRSELLSLRKGDIDWERRMVIPSNHSGETKRSWVTFFNEEAERALKGYLATRKDGSPKLFRISPHNFIDIWKYARQDSGVRVTPQILRRWFCAEMGKLSVPDRYVDAFCGRLCQSVLAMHYTDYSTEKLREIYNGAQLTVFN